jgi:mannose-6-phosphate isomerase
MLNKVSLSSTVALYTLIGGVKHYDWGNVAHSSLVAQLLRSQEVNLNLPYAELWLGDHHLGDNKIKVADELYDIEHFFQISNFSPLPFLFKVLSVSKPLSLQLHPNKAQAEKLHRLFPHIYTDPNQKPESGYALSEVKLLAGIKEKNEIETLCQELSKISELFANCSGSIQLLIEYIFSCDQQERKQLFDLFFNYYRTTFQHVESEHARLFLHLADEYGSYDLGLPLIPFMKLFTFNKHECWFIPPGTLHSYFSGDVAELLYPSDNVIRAGITSKHCDKESLLPCLSTEAQIETILPEKLGENKVCSYKFPGQNFELNVFEGYNKYTLNRNKNSAGIFLSISATGSISSVNTHQRYDIEPGVSILSNLTSKNILDNNHDLEIELQEGLLLFATTC